MTITYRNRFTVNDESLSMLHAAAFGAPPTITPWTERLERHSSDWVGAFDGDDLVGFVHVVTDGGVHRFLLDTVVHPTRWRTGIGRGLVTEAISAARRGGGHWLHVDYEPHLDGFYTACGFRPTSAGLLRL